MYRGRPMPVRLVGGDITGWNCGVLLQLTEGVWMRWVSGSRLEEFLARKRPFNRACSAHSF